MAIGKLDIVIAADTAQIRKDMSTAVGIMQSSSKEFGDYARQASSSITDSFSVIKGAIATIGISELTRDFTKTSDSMQLLEARIKLTSKATDDFKTTQASLLKIANENKSTYQSTGELYARLSPAMSNMTKDTKVVMGVTDAFTKSLLISGASVEESAGSTRQFSQAMASGVLRGEEFNSMMENSPRAMKALMEALGKTQGELRKMSENGELASGIVAGALLKSLGKLREEASKMPNIISGEIEILKNKIAIMVDEINKGTGASEAVVNVIKSIEGLISNTSIDSTQIKEYGNDVIALGEAYLIYKGATIASTAAQSAFNSVQEYSSKVTIANTTATMAATEAERLGTIAVQTRILADQARKEAQLSGLIMLDRHATMLEKEAIASEKAAKSATAHSYELQNVATKTGIVSIAMSGLSTAFKTFAPTAILFGITEIFLNWDKITGSIKTNLVSSSDQLEKMTNNQLSAQLDEYKNKIKETNEAIQKLSPASKGFSYLGSLSDEDKTKAKAQIDTLKQQKEQYEKTVNEIIELKKKSNKEIQNSDINYSNDYLTRSIEATANAQAEKLLREGQAQAEASKRIKETTATIDSQITSLEKQFSIKKEIENLNIESSLRNEAISKPEAERLKEINEISSQIVKNQTEINLLNSKNSELSQNYLGKNAIQDGVEQAKNLQKINDLQKENELNIKKKTAAEERYNATIKAGNDELVSSIASLNISDADKQYQDLAKNVANLIKEGRDLKLVGEYATIVADQIKRNDAYTHLQTELDIRTQIAEVSLYGTDRENALEQIRHESVLANLSKELEAKKLTSDEYLKLLTIENQRNAQNSSSMYKFMLDAFSNIEKAMDENFFNAMTGKFKSFGEWLKDLFKNIGTSIAQGLSRTIAGNITQSLEGGIVNMFKTYSGASASLVGSTLSASDLTSLATAAGSTVANGKITTSGGTVIDQASGTVTSQGSDALSLLSTASSLKTAYGVMTTGISGSILSGFQSVSGLLAQAGFNGAATGVMSFGAGVANPFAYASMSGLPTAMTAGSMLSGGLIGGGLGYGIGAIGDKLLGKNTYASTGGLIAGGLSGVLTAAGVLTGGIGGILIDAVLGSVLGGMFGKTKQTGTGIDVLGNATADSANGQYWTSYKKSSWFSSKSWTDYTPFSDKEIKAIEQSIGVYDYLLGKLGDYNDLVVAGGRFSNLQQFLDTNVVQAFLVQINPNNLNEIYQSWVDYSASINKTITEAITSSVGDYITYQRGFTEWKLGSGTEAQLKFTSEYLQKDFEALASSMGASTVTVDNFLSMYDAAIKNNFTEDTIKAWASLGDALMSSTDAAKKYKDALDELNGKSNYSLPVDTMLSKVKTSQTDINIKTIIESQKESNDEMIRVLTEILKANKILVTEAQFGVVA